MKKQDNAIVGIYKITNPKGKVYIGQSVDIERRFFRYRNIHERDKQPKWGALIPTEDCWVCPCGKYKQEYRNETNL